MSAYKYVNIIENIQKLPLGKLEYGKQLQNDTNESQVIILQCLWINYKSLIIANKFEHYVNILHNLLLILKYQEIAL